MLWLQRSRRRKDFLRLLKIRRMLCLFRCSKKISKLLALAKKRLKNEPICSRNLMSSRKSLRRRKMNWLRRKLIMSGSLHWISSKFCLRSRKLSTWMHSLIGQSSGMRIELRWIGRSSRERYARSHSACKLRRRMLTLNSTWSVNSARSSRLNCKSRLRTLKERRRSWTSKRKI